MDIHNLTAKERKKIHTWLRALIQLLYFIFIPSVYTAAFAGVKYIFTQIGAGEKVAMTSFVTVLLVICLYTMVFGRFFCGFACAFGAFGDALHALYTKACKKMKKKPVKIPEKAVGILSYMKYLVLLLIVFLCYAGVYGKAQGTSPWDVFSMIHAGNFRLGGYGIGLVILLLLMAVYRKDSFAGSSAPWEQYFPCFRYCRFSPFTEREKTAEKDVKHVRRPARLTSAFRRMVTGLSAVIASSVRSVSISVHRSTFTAESGSSKEMSSGLRFCVH